MENKRALLALLIFILIAAVLRPRVTGAPLDTIVVQDAAEVREENVGGSSTLQNLLAAVPPRITYQYAQHTRPVDLASAPSTLQTLLGQVEDRVVLQYAGMERHTPLAPTPPTLLGLLQAVPDRTLIQYAAQNRPVMLSYPFGLIEDTVPPIISNIDVSSVADGPSVVTWTTNEFATSELRYGTQSGNYTDTVTDALYYRQHELETHILTVGTTYYYRVRSTDINGNTAQSPERQFTVVDVYYTYLPAILR